MLTIDVVTLFPEVIAPFVGASIPGRAAAAGLVRYNLVQLRDFTHDRHQTVDDYAYGGGAGMVLKPEPFFEAVESLKPTGPVVLLSARGRPFGHDDAVRFSLGERLTLLCGPYKDVDQLYAAGGVPGARGSRGAALGGSRPDRGLARGGGGAAHAGAAAGAVGADRAVARRMTAGSRDEWRVGTTVAR